MMNKRDIVVLLLGAVVSFSMVVSYDVFFTDHKSLATVDVTAITNEFMRLSTKTKLNEEQINELASAFSEALTEGIQTMSDDNVLLARQAVVSDANDRTDELREYVASRITKRDSN
jgi:hypothetical protein